MADNFDDRKKWWSVFTDNFFVNFFKNFFGSSNKPTTQLGNKLNKYGAPTEGREGSRERKQKKIDEYYKRHGNLNKKTTKLKKIRTPNDDKTALIKLSRYISSPIGIFEKRFPNIVNKG